MAWYFNDNYPWLGMLFCAPIIGLWYWCTDQYIVQRALGAPNETQARRGAIEALGAEPIVWSGGPPDARMAGALAEASHVLVSVAPDADGGVWVATNYGLNHFDGKVWTLRRRNVETSMILSPKWTWARRKRRPTRRQLRKSFLSWLGWASVPRSTRRYILKKRARRAALKTTSPTGR